MIEFDKIILGIILLSIGIIVLTNNKTLVRMAIESQKGVDKALGKKQDYDRIKFAFIPRVVILLIGFAFCTFGSIAILTSFF